MTFNLPRLRNESSVDGAGPVLVGRGSGTRFFKAADGALIVDFFKGFSALVLVVPVVNVDHVWYRYPRVDPRPVTGGTGAASDAVPASR